MHESLQPAVNSIAFSRILLESKEKKSLGATLLPEAAKTHDASGTLGGPYTANISLTGL